MYYSMILLRICLFSSPIRRAQGLFRFAGLVPTPIHQGLRCAEVVIVAVGVDDEPYVLGRKGVFLHLPQQDVETRLSEFIYHLSWIDKDMRPVTA